LVQFSPQILQMFEFSLFNQIVLSLFNISNEFEDNFLANIEVTVCQTV